jgi:hypothetical protein
MTAPAYRCSCQAQARVHHGPDAFEASNVEAVHRIGIYLRRHQETSYFSHFHLRPSTKKLSQSPAQSLPRNLCE